MTMDKEGDVALDQINAEGVEPAKKQRKTRWGEIESSSLQQIEAIQESATLPAVTNQPVTIPFALPNAAPSTTVQSLAAAAAAASLVTSNASQPTTPGLNFNVLAAATAAREALEKARKAALFQQKMREQLQALKASGLAVSPQTILNVSSGNLQLPRPLRLDKYGREVDEEGHVVPIKPQFHSTLKINLNRIREEKKQKETLAAPTPIVPVEGKWVDKTLNTRKVSKKRGLQFIESGTYVKREQQMLRQYEAKSLGIDISKLRREKKEVIKRNAARVTSLEKNKRLDDLMNDVEEDGEFNPNMIPIGGGEMWTASEKTWDEDSVIVEWWDEKFLQKLPDEDENEDFPYRIITDFLNHYVEHPVVPVDSTSKIVPLPMYLTTRERKKLRRRRRQEKEREKQDKIRMGLMPPPAPKAKLANLMRVLGDAAVADPSKVERDVRNQMKQRIALHEQQNEERKLTPAQKSQKKETKWKQVDCERKALLFYVKDLSSKKNLFKVDVNAKQYHLFGCCILCPEVANIVVVEGGPRSIKGFKKLMLSRIKWDDPEGTFRDPEHDDEEEHANGKSDKACVLVWEGVVRKSKFTNWKVYPIKTESEAKQIFKEADVEHYWTRVSDYLPKTLL